MPQPSPKITVNQQFSTSFIKLQYCRPLVRGRKIFGELLPYGAIWRTGANAATTISFGEDVSLAGHPIKAGTYALYTIPGEKGWTIIFNRGVDNWGAAGYKKTEDVLRFQVPVRRLEHPQKSFRISIENLTKNSCDIVLAWADVSVRFPVKAHNNARILAHLKKALKSDDPPYGEAADYYLATGQKLHHALKYVSLAIKEKPQAYYLYWTKAQVYQKLGQHGKALQAAKKAAEMAQAYPAFAYEYQEHYESLLRSE